MSFIADMVGSLKNNKRKRTSTFKKLENAGGIHGKLHFDKKASKKQLQEIREKLQEENKQRVIKNIIIFTTLLSILIYFVAIHKY